MKIDILKNIKNFIYCDEVGTVMPFWQPVGVVAGADDYPESYIEYLKDGGTNIYYYEVKPVIEYSHTLDPASDISFYIGFEKSVKIDNIELDVSGTFGNITLNYSMCNWRYGYEDDPKFDNFSWFDTTTYLNREKTFFNEQECMTLKLTFTDVSSLVLNDIIINSEENIIIPVDVLNDFVFESFSSNNILSIYKDTDIKTTIQRYNTMMNEENA